eukprot:TRINITY_DN21777_c0_g1_i1.p1 TRINITY_DN21777_c0_g1~~TRINITY_DN21777_c0_g1_i1.p1  ORF type:complete len:217 (-),score=22.50 TRINITY_DN21777_c0_g1_i1:31-681(-)
MKRRARRKGTDKKKLDKALVRLAKGGDELREMKMCKVLRDGANPDLKLPGVSLTILHWAVEVGSLRVVGELLGAKANPNQEVWNGTPLHFSILKGSSTEVVDALLKGKCDASAQSAGTLFTPLHLACRQSHPKSSAIVSMLLSRGAHPYAMDAFQRVPLDYIQGRSPMELAITKHFAWLTARCLYVGIKDPNSLLYGWPREIITMIISKLFPSVID